MIYLDADGNQKHVKEAGVKLVEREKEGAHPGKVMAVTGGTHSGLLCEVLALEPKVGKSLNPEMTEVCAQTLGEHLGTRS